MAPGRQGAKKKGAKFPKPPVLKGLNASKYTGKNVRLQFFN